MSIVQIVKERAAFLEELRLTVNTLWDIEHTDERSADELRSIARETLKKLAELDAKYGLDINNPQYSGLPDTSQLGYAKSLEDFGRA